MVLLSESIKLNFFGLLSIVNLEYSWKSYFSVLSLLNRMNLIQISNFIINIYFLSENVLKACLIGGFLYILCFQPLIYYRVNINIKWKHHQVYWYVFCSSFGIIIVHMIVTEIFLILFLKIDWLIDWLRQIIVYWCLILSNRHEVVLKWLH